MCILCEPKYKKDNSKENQSTVADRWIYNNGKFEVTNEYEYDGGYGGFYIKNGNELYAISDDPYCGAGPLTINYCPICNKRLEHKETK